MIRINLELETRMKELDVLKAQLDQVNAEISVHRAGPSAFEITGIDSNPVTRKSIGRQPRVASTKSVHLVELETRRCEEEMRRTRMFDGLFDDEEKLLNQAISELKEMQSLGVQIRDIRKEYNAQCIDDFNVLVDLGLTAEQLHSDWTNERNSKRMISRSTKKLVPIVHESTVALQLRVDELQTELVSLEKAHTEECMRLTATLGRTRTGQRNSKLRFQQEMKSVFTDFKFLHDRINKAESSLEKLNVHYALTEEEMLTVVAPLIDEIDHARDILQNLQHDAETILYED